LYEIQQQPTYAPAIHGIQELLGKAASIFPVIPSVNPPNSEITIVSKRPFAGTSKALQQLLLGSAELLCEVELRDERSLSVSLGRDNATVSELLDLVARQFFIPRAQLSASDELDSNLSFPKTVGLCVLRTDMGGIVDPTGLGT
jgi:hypothetical protein